ncbi:Cyclin-T-2 [Tetrabaena socialis]|uniref:Cyclin-T-2 n=1 Tax=Tetrabaena socialis TaxID=47790 RepID=A0A2J8AG27_9CHLO|nr:Cyclin-T-2 [Tetrabaena socialis]|eukprot:PNH11469.1 Cyclin-T-2 [Tetrabaena socialis]
MATFQGFPQQPVYPQQPAMNYVIEGGYGYDGETGLSQSPHQLQQRQTLRDQEHKLDLAIETAKKASRYAFRTLEDLRANNPSVRDGLDPDKERTWRRQYCKVIQDAGVALKM